MPPPPACGWEILGLAPERSRAGPGYRLAHVAGGGRVAPEGQAWVRDGLTAAFPDLRMGDYFGRNPDWFPRQDHLVLAAEAPRGPLVAVLASRWFVEADGFRFLHVTTQLIAARWRRSPMLRHMWSLHFDALRQGEAGFPRLLVLKTCNPSAFRSMAIFARIEDIDIYPRVDGTPQAPQAAALARRIAHCISPGHPFAPSTGVLSGVGVPPDFYPALPAGVRQEELERHFHDHLTPADRILCIADIRTEAAQHRLCRLFGVPG
ncbi:hypothetical protein AY600_14125 [Phormidium willei BDU 130791]|nr:hypothetical protein AY600_14125 [Phormidium willei BDU 130791]